MSSAIVNPSPAEIALRESERRQRALLDSIPDAAWLKDRNGRYLAVNQVFAARFRLPLEDIVGRRDVDFLPSDRAARFVDDNAKVIETGETLRVETVMQVDGAPRWFEALIVPIRDDAGRVVGTAGSARDTTDRKRSEEALTSLSASLEEKAVALAATNRELESFAYTVAHDLRAPLRSINGFAAVLTRSSGATLTPTDRKFLERIGANATRMGALIDHLLYFSSLGRAELQFADVDLEQLAKEIVEELRETRRAAEVRIDSMPSAYCDRVLVRQVLANLIGNALKFTGGCDQPLIEIGSTQSGAETVYFVRDNGIGFDMAYAEMLFGVFNRLHHAEEFEGTGVGLAIVKRIIERHRGRVWAQAEAGKGATFFFTLGKR